MNPKRRTTLVALAAIAGGYAALRWLSLPGARDLDFVALDSPAGFRKLSAGAVSSAFDPFAGIAKGPATTGTASASAVLARVRAAPCDALYGPVRDGAVPVASFSDYYCPYCRVQTIRLARLAEAAPDDITLAWHEWPLLGEDSTLAARAALAARRQGAYVAFHEHLMRSPFKATEGYLARLSTELGVDRARLLADMRSDAVTRELENSAALGRLFAFRGTPALVIGRTVVEGEVDDETIRRIVETERDGAWRSACS